MLRISNIAIGIKLAAMSGLGILLVVGMIVTQMLGNASVRTANSEAIGQQNIEREVTEAKSAGRGMQIAVRDIRLAASKEALQRAVKMLEERQRAAHEMLDPLVQRLRVPENRARAEKLRGLVDQYAAGAKDIATIKAEAVDLITRGIEAAHRVEKINADAEKYARERTLPLAAEIENLIQEVAQIAHNLARSEIAKAEQEMASAERLGLIIGALVVIMLIGSAIFGAVSIARPLKALTQPINELAGGNFNVVVNGVGRKDEVGQIATAVNAMVERIRNTIAEVKSSAREVTNASAEIATSTTDLSQRTEEQAASLEETSAAMEELAATVKKNAENAQQANQSARDTREVADRGGQVVAKAVDAMARIEESSRKISDIIGVIDEIARQTNLLALNAAVEAARAGEAGRGFAVVASEVRSLAQRSSQAAKDIKDLITNSNSQVKDGVELVNQAGSALNEIVESIRKVADLVSEIASASTEQATGLDQISKALAQMDEVTQQNSALVEENAATAKTLEDQAKSMDEQVAFFRIDAVAAEPRPAVSAKAEDKRAPVDQVAPKAATHPAAGKSAPAAAPKKPIDAATAARAVAGRSGGPARRMQAAVATAFKADPEWKEF